MRCHKMIKDGKASAFIDATEITAFAIWLYSGLQKYSEWFAFESIESKILSPICMQIM